MNIIFLCSEKASNRCFHLLWDRSGGLLFGGFQRNIMLFIHLKPVYPVLATCLAYKRRLLFKN